MYVVLPHHEPAKRLNHPVGFLDDRVTPFPINFMNLLVPPRYTLEYPSPLTGPLA